MPTSAASVAVCKQNIWQASHALADGCSAQGVQDASVELQIEGVIYGPEGLKSTILLISGSPLQGIHRSIKAVAKMPLDATRPLPDNYLS
jgi:hypothetical protein